MPAAVAVAASGGRDSTALLHATARAARELGLEVHALHVHHGLVASADTWLARLRSQCARWARAGLPVHFHSARLTGAPARGESVEAWARRGRYAALAAMAKAAGCDLVLLAQHRRDQAETLLLQALRGGGADALAAMPRRAERDGVVWARPWLDHPREEIEAYLRRHRLRWVDDESNDDEAFARNRLRRQVWPALLAAFPEAEQQLAASARRAAEAAAALQALADSELRALSEGGRLDVAGWRLLPETYRAPVLRRWLQSAIARPVPESLVRRLADELPAAASARWPAPDGELRLHDGRLVYAPPQAAGMPRPESLALDLSSPRIVELPSWGGVLEVTPVGEGGVSPAWLRAAELRARLGGESFQAAPRATPRALKKQFQVRRVAAWDRAGPLVFSGGQLVFVPGLGIDARCRAAAGEVQLALVWRPA